jgi:carboxylesterase type B
MYLVDYYDSIALNKITQGPECLTPPRASNVNPSSSNPANLTAAGAAIAGQLAALGIETSEDCLTLNIWTKPQNGESKKAVMVFIYGGTFVTGASSIPLWNGQHIANEEDVIVVTFK